MVGEGLAKVQCNVYLPLELVKAGKHRAIEEGRSLSAVVATALSDYLSKGTLTTRRT